MCNVNNSTSQISRIFCWVRGASPEDHQGMRIIHVREMYSLRGFPVVKKMPYNWPILSGNKRKGIRMLNVVLNFADDLCKQ